MTVSGTGHTVMLLHIGRFCDTTRDLRLVIEDLGH
jgi:hypothetical protein